MEYSSLNSVFNRIFSFIGMLVFSYFMVFSIDISFDNQGNVWKNAIDSEIDNAEVINNGFLVDCQENLDHVTIVLNSNFTDLFSKFLPTIIAKELFNLPHFLTSFLQDIILPPPQLNCFN